MPSPFIHLNIAARVADALTLSSRQRGAFALGSIAPDINNQFGWHRRQTHFWNPAADGGVSGAGKLLAAYPQLAARHLSTEEQAFVAGYLSHLITDEEERVVLYASYFGGNSGYRGDDATGKALRLVLLAIIETQAVATNRLTGALANLEAGCRASFRERLLPFASNDDLHQWGRKAIAAARLGPGLARMRRERRDLSGELVARWPALEVEVRRYVPGSAMQTFEEMSVDESVAYIKAYLAGTPLPVPKGTAPAIDSPCGRGWTDMLRCQLAGCRQHLAAGSSRRLFSRLGDPALEAVGAHDQPPVPWLGGPRYDVTTPDRFVKPLHRHTLPLGGGGHQQPLVGERILGNVVAGFGSNRSLLDAQAIAEIPHRPVQRMVPNGICHATARRTEQRIVRASHQL